MENLRISTIQNSMIRSAAQILPGTGCYSGKVSECPGRRACIFFPSDRYSAGRIFRAAYENRLLSGCMTRNNQRGIHFSRPCIFSVLQRHKPEAASDFTRPSEKTLRTKPQPFMPPHRRFLRVPANGTPSSLNVIHCIYS